MAFKLTKTERAAWDDLRTKLSEAAVAVNDGVEHFNSVLAAAKGDIDEDEHTSMMDDLPTEVEA